MPQLRLSIVADGRLEVVRIDSAVRIPVAGVQRFVAERLEASAISGGRYNGGIAGGRPIRRLR